MFFEAMEGDERDQERDPSLVSGKMADFTDDTAGKIAGATWNMGNRVARE